MTHKEFFVWLSGFLSAVESNTLFEIIKRQMAEVEETKFIVSHPDIVVKQPAVPEPTVEVISAVADVIVEPEPVIEPEPVAEPEPVVVSNRRSPFYSAEEPDKKKVVEQAPELVKPKLLYRI